jgi:hypothetical protein
MSLLSLQVACLIGAYRPPRAEGGDIHRLYDEPDPPDLVEADYAPECRTGFKVCKTCGEEKPIEDFYHRSGRNCRTSVCKECYKIATRKRTLARLAAKGVAPARKKSSETRLNILKALGMDRLSAKAVAVKIGIDPEHCRRYMDRLTDEGRLIKEGSYGSITYRAKR